MDEPFIKKIIVEISNGFRYELRDVSKVTVTITPSLLFLEATSQEWEVIKDAEEE